MDVKKTLERILSSFEKQYVEDKSKEAEELHNSLAEVIAQHKATAQNTLFVLEMLKFEVLSEKFAQYFIKSDKKPVSTSRDE